MKTIVLFTRRNVGMAALSYLTALGHKVKVITDDEDVLWLAKTLSCELVTMWEMGDYDILLSVHWHKVIPNEYLLKPSINIHPCLFKYKGHNPIKRYIENKDTKGSVGCHYMTNVIDEGELIYEVFFDTPVCSTYADYYNVALPYYFKAIKTVIENVK